MTANVCIWHFPLHSEVRYHSMLLLDVSSNQKTTNVKIWFLQEDCVEVSTAQNPIGEWNNVVCDSVDAYICHSFKGLFHFTNSISCFAFLRRFPTIYCCNYYISQTRLTYSHLHHLLSHVLKDTQLFGTSVSNLF